MSDRKEGWYWVRFCADWECAKWTGEGWRRGNVTSLARDSAFEEIGNRIPTPDEMEGWQVVPKEPTGPMYAALKNQDHAGGIDFDALLKWSAALRAAPKPGDV